MVSKEYITSIIFKYKEKAKLYSSKRKNDLALEMISNAAKLLYETNIEYKDDMLEDMLEKISINLNLKKHRKEDASNTLLFYDGFGLNNRGLAQIYLNALVKFNKIIYVTYEDCKNDIPDLFDIFNKNNVTVQFVKRNGVDYCNQIYQLNHIIEKYKPQVFMYYSTPSDVVAPTVLFAYNKIFKRYQINLTDHAFWLGCKCIDFCIEFRNYGAYISKTYRNINPSKILKLPFYPILHVEKEFKGYPFELKDNQKVVFSGGSLYKTIGANNKYYKIVEKLLVENCNMIFWYAGSGDDTYLKELKNKFPKRVYHTSERSDLYQILQNSCFYLSTYPICGGLMFQYAAKAGCVPITLKYDDISSEFLINQNEINVEFKNESILYEECKRILSDENYRKKRAIQLKDAVISEDKFEANLEKIIKYDNSDFLVEFKPVSTEKLKLEYINRITKKDLDVLIANKQNMRGALLVTPIRLLMGIFYKVLKKL